MHMSHKFNNNAGGGIIHARAFATCVCIFISHRKCIFCVVLFCIYPYSRAFTIIRGIQIKCAQNTDQFIIEYLPAIQRALRPAPPQWPAAGEPRKLCSVHQRGGLLAFRSHSIIINHISIKCIAYAIALRPMWSCGRGGELEGCDCLQAFQVSGSMHGDNLKPHRRTPTTVIALVINDDGRTGGVCGECGCFVSMRPKSAAIQP